MAVQVSVTQIVNASVADAFTAAVSIDPRDLIRKYGPLPAIVDVDGHDAPWSAIGDVRRHQLSDNSSVREELMTFEPHKTFGYLLTNFTGPFAQLASSARADWRFAEDAGGGARIDWTYEFIPASMAAEPVLWFVVKLFWPGYLKAALARVKQRAEAAPS